MVGARGKELSVEQPTQYMAQLNGGLRGLLAAAAGSLYVVELYMQNPELFILYSEEFTHIINVYVG